MLESLADARPLTFSVPRVIDFFDWHEATVLLLAALPVQGRANRPLGETELAVLAELAALTPALAGVLETEPGNGFVPVHGDFAPWNSSVDGSGHVYLWDWEETRPGLPLEDYFHWELQRLLRFGSGDARTLVTQALTGSGRVRYACRRLGVDPASAPHAFSTYLRWKPRQQPARPAGGRDTPGGARSADRRSDGRRDGG